MAPLATQGLTSPAFRRMNQPVKFSHRGARREEDGETSARAKEKEDEPMNEHQCPYGGEFGMDFLELEECKDCEWTYECGDACFGGLD